MWIIGGRGGERGTGDELGVMITVTNSMQCRGSCKVRCGRRSQRILVSHAISRNVRELSTLLVIKFWNPPPPAGCISLQLGL